MAARRSWRDLYVAVGDSVDRLRLSFAPGKDSFDLHFAVDLALSLPLLSITLGHLYFYSAKAPYAMLWKFGVCVLFLIMSVTGAPIRAPSPSLGLDARFRRHIVLPRDSEKFGSLGKAFGKAASWVSGMLKTPTADAAMLTNSAPLDAEGWDEYMSRFDPTETNFDHGLEEYYAENSFHRK